MNKKKWFNKNGLKLILAIDFLIFFILFLMSGSIGKIEFITFSGFACLITLKILELQYLKR